MDLDAGYSSSLILIIGNFAGGGRFLQPSRVQVIILPNLICTTQLQAAPLAIADTPKEQAAPGNKFRLMPGWGDISNMNTSTAANNVIVNSPGSSKESLQTAANGLCSF